MVGNDWVSPLDFWELSPGQAWWIVRAKMPKDAAEHADNMSSLYRFHKEAKARAMQGKEAE